MSAKDGTCCGLAAKLGPAKLAELDAELRRTNHRAFRKLAAEHGVRHNAVERHKKGCLHLGEAAPREVRTFEAPDTSKLPPITRRPTKKRVSHVSHGTDAGTAGVPDGTEPASGTEGDSGTRARAGESCTPAELHRQRVLEIMSSMTDGTWDTPWDNVDRRVKEWSLSRSTVERMVLSASVGAEVDPATVKLRRSLAMEGWAWGKKRAREAIDKGPVFPDTMSKLLSAYAQMQTGWDKAAGVLDESPKTINIVGHPVFMGMLESVILAVQPFPEARAAVAAAVRAKLDVLRQPVPAALVAAPETIETTGEAA